jgi:hypothetical protein
VKSPSKSTGPLFRPTAVSVAVVSLLCSAAEPLRAQSHENPGRRASFTAGASFGDGETALASSLALDFRLTRRLGLEFELAHARKLDFTLDLCPAPLVCVRGGRLPVTGRTVSLVPHVVLELLPAARRLGAYALAGLGGGHVRQRYFTGPPLTNPFTEPVELTRSKVTAALSIGGGAAVKISSRLAVGADVRSLQVFDDKAKTDRFIMPSGVLSTVRVGTRVSWQF